jgi:hypothetical protein
MRYPRLFASFFIYISIFINLYLMTTVSLRTVNESNILIPGDAQVRIPLLSNSCSLSRPIGISFGPSCHLSQVFRKPTEDAFPSTLCYTLLKASKAPVGLPISDSSLVLALLEDILDLQVMTNICSRLRSRCVGRRVRSQILCKGGILDNGYVQLCFRDGHETMGHRSPVVMEFPGLSF